MRTRLCFASRAVSSMRHHLSEQSLLQPCATFWQLRPTVVHENICLRGAAIVRSHRRSARKARKSSQQMLVLSFAFVLSSKPQCMRHRIFCYDHPATTTATSPALLCRLHTFWRPHRRFSCMSFFHGCCRQACLPRRSSFEHFVRNSVIT